MTVEFQNGGPTLPLEGAAVEGSGSQVVEVPPAPPEAAPRPRGRSRRRRRGGKRTTAPAERAAEAAETSEEEQPPAREEARGDERLLFNTVDPEEVRVALLRSGRLEELRVEVASRVSYLGNIYRARVVNVEPSIGAAFVDFGASRNGFLHVNDVLPALGRTDFRLEDLASAKAGAGEGPEALRAVFEGDDAEEERPPRPSERPPIEQRLRRGQEIVAQIIKDGIGTKGPALTTYVSLPGRYLVLMPSLPRCGVSRKIEDARERARLRRLLEELSPPAELGFIIRTAGEGRTQTELQQDLEFLLRLWETLRRRLRDGRGPALLYEESEPVTRGMRDLYTPSMREIVVDEESVERRVAEFLERYVPRASTRVVRHAGPVPLFHAYGVEAEVDKVFARKITLPSGGSIVFDQTEALVAIDVNSGRYRREADLEETAFRIDLEAIPEIARQVRLRDLGGQIVIDFIDLLESKHRRAVERALRDALRGDRARVRLGRIGPFGILEMTRQRLGPGVKQGLYGPCLACAGSGWTRTPESTAVRALREAAALLARRGTGTIEIAVHPDVEHYLANVKRRALVDFEAKSGRSLLVVSDRRLPPGEVRVRALGAPPPPTG